MIYHFHPALWNLSRTRMDRNLAKIMFFSAAAHLFKWNAILASVKQPPRCPISTTKRPERGFHYFKGLSFPLSLEGGESKWIRRALIICGGGSGADKKRKIRSACWRRRRTRKSSISRPTPIFRFFYTRLSTHNLRSGEVFTAEKKRIITETRCQILISLHTLYLSGL